MGITSSQSSSSNLHREYQQNALKINPYSTNPFHSSYQAQAEELTYYTEVTDQHLGNLEVYSLQKMSGYFVVKVKLLDDYSSQASLASMYNTYQAIENMQADVLINLYGYEIKRKKMLCHCNKQKKFIDEVVSYWQYYNYYFNQVINNKFSDRNIHINDKTQLSYASNRRKNNIFSESELWHLLMTVVEAYSIFLAHGLHLELTEDVLVLTPEGRLKIFWIHNLLPNNAHVMYYRYFTKDNPYPPLYSNYDHSVEAHYLYPHSPEQLRLLSYKEMSRTIQLQKCNSYRLGIMLAHCIIGSYPNYYNSTTYEYNQFAIQNIKQNIQESKLYSKELKELACNLLAKKAADRIGIRQIRTIYGYLMKEEYEIKVFANRDKQEKQEKVGRHKMDPDIAARNSYDAYNSKSNRNFKDKHNNFNDNQQHNSHSISMLGSYVVRDQVRKDYQRGSKNSFPIEITPQLSTIQELKPQFKTMSPISKLAVQQHSYLSQNSNNSPFRQIDRDRSSLGSRRDTGRRPQEDSSIIRDHRLHSLNKPGVFTADFIQPAHFHLRVN